MKALLINPYPDGSKMISLNHKYWVQVLILISQRMIMDSSKNGRWIISFKKFGRLRVKYVAEICVQKIYYLVFFYLEKVAINSLITSSSFEVFSIVFYLRRLVFPGSFNILKNQCLCFKTFSLNFSVFSDLLRVKDFFINLLKDIFLNNRLQI